VPWPTTTGKVNRLISPKRSWSSSHRNRGAAPVHLQLASRFGVQLVGGGRDPAGEDGHRIERSECAMRVRASRVDALARRERNPPDDTKALRSAVSGQPSPGSQTPIQPGSQLPEECLVADRGTTPRVFGATVERRIGDVNQLRHTRSGRYRVPRRRLTEPRKHGAL
jgi:hypothetical protein